MQCVWPCRWNILLHVLQIVLFQHISNLCTFYHLLYSSSFPFARLFRFTELETAIYHGYNGAGYDFSFSSNKYSVRDDIVTLPFYSIRERNITAGVYFIWNEIPTSKTLFGASLVIISSIYFVSNMLVFLPWNCAYHVLWYVTLH